MERRLPQRRGAETRAAGEARAGGGPSAGRTGGGAHQDCAPGAASPRRPRAPGPRAASGAVSAHARVALHLCAPGSPPPPLRACHPSPPSWFSRGVLEGSRAPRTRDCPPAQLISSPAGPRNPTSLPSGRGPADAVLRVGRGGSGGADASEMISPVAGRGGRELLHQMLKLSESPPPNPGSEKGPVGSGQAFGSCLERGEWSEHRLLPDGSGVRWEDSCGQLYSKYPQRAYARHCA